VAAHPRTTDIAQGVAGALAAVAEARRYCRSSDRRELAVSLPLWSVGLSLHILGRTDRPLR